MRIFWGTLRFGFFSNLFDIFSIFYIYTFFRGAQLKGHLLMMTGKVVKHTHKKRHSKIIYFMLYHPQLFCRCVRARVRACVRVFACDEFTVGGAAQALAR